jgi:hypothetical protein
MGRRTYYFLLLKVMLTLSLIPLAFCSTYPKPYILSATIDYKSYYWVNWFKPCFFGSWLRSWSFRFLRNLCFASLFYSCIVSSNIGSFANLAGYPPFCVNLLDLPTYDLSMETTHHKKVPQREDSSSLSSRHLVPTLTPLPLCSGTSKHLSMGEEVGTMQIRVLGEIQKWIRWEANKKNPKYLTCQKEKKKKKEENKKKKKKKYRVIIISPGSLVA